MEQSVAMVRRFLVKELNAIGFNISMMAVILILELSLVPPTYAADEAPRDQVDEGIHLTYEGSYELTDKTNRVKPAPSPSVAKTLHKRMKRQPHTTADPGNDHAEQPKKIISGKIKPPDTYDPECLRSCTNATAQLTRDDSHQSNSPNFTMRELQIVMKHNLRCVEECRRARQ